MNGGCACGRIRFTAEVDSDDAYYCHCRMCQRASGAISLAMIGIDQDKVDWHRKPDWYDSSPIARRPFCAVCGTSLGFQFKEGAGMDLTVAAFDDPSRFVPVVNAGSESMLHAWLDVSGLPEKPTGENPNVVRRWEAVGQQVPD